MIMHFKSQKERLDFLKGNFEEIKPVEIKPIEAKIEPKMAESSNLDAENEKKSQKKASKGKKKAKKEQKDDTVQAE